ncbi:NTP-binding protein, partial [Streptomyces sp. B1866]|nr:NTP-binding protein [Streptomyces sp. B1866]
MARHLLPQWQHEGLLTLRHWRGTWMRWELSHWRELDDQALRAWLYQHLEHATYPHTTPGGGTEERDWAPTI